TCYSFSIDECNSFQFQTIKIIDDNNCVFENSILNPGSFSCMKVDGLWTITVKESCNLQCVYSWKFSTETNVISSSIYTCISDLTNPKPATVKLLAGAPIVHTISLSTDFHPDLPHMYIVQYFNDKCLIYSPMHGIRDSSCSCTPESNTCNFTLVDYTATYNFIYNTLDNSNTTTLAQISKFNINSPRDVKLFDDPVGISTKAATNLSSNDPHVKEVKLYYGLPKIYNFRVKLSCGNLLVSVHIIDDACFATTFRDNRFRPDLKDDDIVPRFYREKCSKDGQVTVNECTFPCSVTFNFDPTNPGGSYSSHLMCDGNDKGTTDNAVIYLQTTPNDPIPVYTASEIVLSCWFGINVINNRLMIPRNNISECVDSYTINRTINSTPFYSQLTIGKAINYPCEDIVNEAIILCEAYTNYVDNAYNFYQGLHNAMDDVGANLDGMINDLTANVENKDRAPLTLSSILLIVSAVLMLPLGSWVAIGTKELFVGVFPLMSSGVRIYATILQSERSSLLSPLNYAGFEKIFLDSIDNVTDSLDSGIKQTDDIGSGTSLLLNQTLEGFLNYSKGDQNDFRKVYTTEFQKRLARLILLANDVAICKNDNNKFNANGNCGAGVNDKGCHGFSRACGTVITNYGSGISKNVTKKDFKCLITNGNFYCPQIQKIESYGVKVTELCDTGDSLSLPVVDCYSSLFWCDSQLITYNFCWGHSD
ncbi:6988_t:CDS:2, partial [Dentiscutata heterogama]